MKVTTTMSRWRKANSATNPFRRKRRLSRETFRVAAHRKNRMSTISMPSRGWYATKCGNYSTAKWTTTTKICWNIDWSKFRWVRSVQSIDTLQKSINIRFWVNWMERFSFYWWWWLDRSSRSGAYGDVWKFRAFPLRHSVCTDSFHSSDDIN